MQSTSVAPQLVRRVDLDGELPSLPELAPGGHRYRRALLLLVLHGVPVSVVEVEVTPGVGTSPTLLAALIWPRVSDGVNAHLREDGLPEVTGIDPWRGVVRSTNGTGPACQHFPTAGLSGHDVSVVIPTVGRSPVLGALIGTLLDGAVRPREILVVVNGLQDRAMVSALETHVVPGLVRVVQVPRRGAAHARNQGARLVRSRVVAFLDDDVEVDRGWLQGVLRGFGRHDDVSCVTGLILPASLDAPAQVHLQHFGGFDKGAVATLFDRDEHALPHPLYPYLPGVYGSGANLALRVEAFRALGGFDERLGPGTATRGGEDIDLLMRVVLEGRKIAYEPQALVHHHHRVADRALRRTMFGYGSGLGAVLVKHAAQREGRREIARRVPQGVRYLLSGRSPKNACTGGTGYPMSLRAAELTGLVASPLVYARSRVVSGRER